MSELGKILQQARKKKRLSLEKVHKLTRISQAYLVGLEESNVKAFPAEVYYKNFLKNYAKFLELDVDKVVKIYENEKADKQNDLFANIENSTNKEIEITKVKSKNKKDKRNIENNKNSETTNELDTKKILYAKIILVTVCCILFICVVATILKNKNCCNVAENIQTQDEVQEVKEQKIVKQTLTIEAINKVNVTICADNKEIFKGTLYAKQQQICYANESFSITIDNTKNLKLLFNDKVIDIEKFVEKNKSNTLNFNKDIEI